MIGRWFSPGTLVSSTNKTDLHDRTEILLKVALKTIKSKPSFIKLSKKISALGSIGGGSAVLVKSFVFLF